MQKLKALCQLVLKRRTSDKQFTLDKLDTILAICFRLYSKNINLTDHFLQCMTCLSIRLIVCCFFPVCVALLLTLAFFLSVVLWPLQYDLFAHYVLVTRKRLYYYPLCCYKKRAIHTIIIILNRTAVIFHKKC